MFLVALILTAVTVTLNYGFTLLLPLFQPGPFGGGNSLQLYVFTESLASFAFSPIISFLIFYKIGSMISVKTISDHFHILRSTFMGGAAGYAVGYAGLMAYLWVANGSGSFGPNTDWLLELGQIALAFVRGGIDMAFLAFAGVMVGTLRSSAKSSGATGPTPTTPENNTSA